MTKDLTNADLENFQSAYEKTPCADVIARAVQENGVTAARILLPKPITITFFLLKSKPEKLRIKRRADAAGCFQRSIRFVSRWQKI